MQSTALTIGSDVELTMSMFCLGFRFCCKVPKASRRGCSGHESSAAGYKPVELMHWWPSGSLSPPRARREFCPQRARVLALCYCRMPRLLQ